MVISYSLRFCVEELHVKYRISNKLGRQRDAPWMRHGGASTILAKTRTYLVIDQARQLTSCPSPGTAWKLLCTLLSLANEIERFGNADSARERPNVAAGCVVSFLFILICCLSPTQASTEHDEISKPNILAGVRARSRASPGCCCA